jgi:hypothetical protein
MTCDDYLAMLETLPLEELGYGAARDHAAHCHDCNRVTRVVAERERSMILAMADVRSSMPSADLAYNSVVMARRRRIAVFYKIGLAVAAVATVMGIIVARVRPTVAPVALIHQKFFLQCLSPDQAAALLRSNLDDANRLSLRARPPLGVIDVSAPAVEMLRVRALIDRYDNPSQTKCAVQVVVPRR